MPILNASISTKLVSETGVGTVAAGVVKAKSDHVVMWQVMMVVQVLHH